MGKASDRPRSIARGVPTWQLCRSRAPPVALAVTRTVLRRIATVVLALGARGAASQPVVPMAAPAPSFPAPADGAAAYLVTAGPGDELLSWFGHAAIVVADARTGAAWYDYALIDERANAIRSYATGHIRAKVRRLPVPEWTLGRMRAADRAVLVQALRFTPHQLARLQQRLDADIDSLVGGYAYDHVGDNCSTRVRDALDAASDGALRRVTRGRMAPFTVREDAFARFVAGDRAVAFGMDVVGGEPVDRQLSAWDAMYLPSVLAYGVARSIAADGGPLAVVQASWPARRPPIVTPPSYRASCAIVGLLLGATALALGAAAPRRRSARVAFGAYAALAGTLVGIVGVAIAFAMTATAFALTFRNENVLLADPFALATVPLAVRAAFGSCRAARWLRVAWAILAGVALGALAIKALPGVRQANARELLLFLPVVFGVAGGAWLASSRPEAGREGVRRGERDRVHAQRDRHVHEHPAADPPRPERQVPQHVAGDDRSERLGQRLVHVDQAVRQHRDPDRRGA